MKMSAGIWPSHIWLAEWISESALWKSSKALITQSKLAI